MNFEYLLFNFIIFFLSTFSIFVVKGTRYPQLRPALLAILSISVPYILWDAVVAGWWWSFNPRFILGFSLGPLPVEELLFFFVVPWSCLIIWENLKERVKGKVSFHFERLVAVAGVILLGISVFQEWWYSASIGGLMCLFSVISTQCGKWFEQKASLLYVAIVFLLTCIFNGYLTWRPVVIYNTLTKSNLNLGTIPLEDVVYGLVLVSAVAIVYEALVNFPQMAFQKSPRQAQPK